MNFISQLEVDNIDVLVSFLRNNYEEKTGKKLDRIDVCDLTDFINFYGGSVEFADLDGGIKSVVVKGKDVDDFKIVVSNELNFDKTKENWSNDYKEIIQTKGENESLVKHAKEMLDKGPSRHYLNMELVRAFGNYLFVIKQGKLNYGDAIPTIYDRLRTNPTEQQINNSIQTAKSLVLIRK